MHLSQVRQTQWPVQLSVVYDLHSCSKAHTFFFIILFCIGNFLLPFQIREKPQKPLFSLFLELELVCLMKTETRQEDIVSRETDSN